jgi:hypothetical protein
VIAPRFTRLLLLGAALTTSACSATQPYYSAGKISVAPAADAQVDHRLLLIGDAGDADPKGEPALELLARQVRLLPDRTTVAFLGDNVYERGMPEAGESKAAGEAAEAANAILPKVFDSRQQAERLLDAQVDTVRGTAAKGVFIPGNHDWDPFAAGGWKRVLAQEEFLKQDSHIGAGADVEMVPEGGCPGPVPIPLGKRGMLIVLDTEWFLELAVKKDQPNDKPCPENNPTGCKCTTEQDVASALVDDLREAARQGRWAIVAAHHPLNSAGPHGGFVDPLTHLFPLRFMRHYLPWYVEWIPLPVLGTFAVLARQHFSPSPQDFSNAKNIHLRDLLRDAMADAEKQNAPALLYAAGHDHSLQVFKTPRGPRYTVVSGLGAMSRASEVGSTHNTLFAHTGEFHTGFMQVDFLRGGGVRLAVLESEKGNPAVGREVFSMMLAESDASRGPRGSVRSESLWRRARTRASSVWHKIDRD